jgi:RNA polymerase sigma factor (sigma-70 family)
METPGQWDAWCRRLVEGEGDVVMEFWQTFGQRLQRLAAQRLSLRLARRLGPEDVAQSVCRTFLRRLQQGQFELASSEQLWRLLCAITLAKVREQQRFHGRAKRALDRENPLAVDNDGETVWLDVASREPTPDETVQFTDQLEQTLGCLNDEEKQVLHLKLEQYTNQEIAAQIGCSERTVRRLLGGIKTRLHHLLEETLC